MSVTYWLTQMTSVTPPQKFFISILISLQSVRDEKRGKLCTKEIKELHEELVLVFSL